MSRRAAEAEIAAGNVRVNGVVASLGDKAAPARDEITIKGKRIKPAPARRTYIMLNKPSGYVSTLSDDKGRKDITELIKDVGVRVYPVGRLDMFSEGLLILTDDGELTNLLTHPRNGVEKKYLVRLAGRVSPEAIEALGQPMELDGEKLRRAGVRFLSASDDSTLLEMTLREGKNRQIRRMCESLGLRVVKLIRVAEGELRLGELPSGKWRRLTDEEVAKLYREAVKRNGAAK